MSSAAVRHMMRGAFHDSLANEDVATFTLQPKVVNPLTFPQAASPPSLEVGTAGTTSSVAGVAEGGGVLVGVFDVQGPYPHSPTRRIHTETPTLVAGNELENLGVQVTPLVDKCRGMAWNELYGQNQDKNRVGHDHQSSGEDPIGPSALPDQLFFDPVPSEEPVPEPGLADAVGCAVDSDVDENREKEVEDRELLLNPPSKDLHATCSNLSSVGTHFSDAEQNLICENKNCAPAPRTTTSGARRPNSDRQKGGIRSGTPGTRNTVAGVLEAPGRATAREVRNGSRSPGEQAGVGVAGDEDHGDQVPYPVAGSPDDNKAVRISLLEAREQILSLQGRERSSTDDFIRENFAFSAGMQ
eukprot:g15599.t1